jgi:hypothetical protein
MREKGPALATFNRLTDAAQKSFADLPSMQAPILVSEKYAS